ncbi:MAG: cell division protein FtsA [Rhizobiales bacterium]|nr:cell division protein FtsA [Hyphomicrobiales bacterium]
MSVVPLHSSSGPKAAAPDKTRLIAALDIGSTKVSCLIAQASPARHRLPGGEEQSTLRILGVGHQASRGVKAGAIIDVDEAEKAIRLAVDAAERMAQRTISQVWVNLSGGRPRSSSHTGAVRTRNGEVNEVDLAAAMRQALETVRPGRRTVLHVAPVQYQLDDAKGLKSPVGMFGEMLGVELNVVTCEAAHMRNLALAVERCHLSVAGTVITPYAAAKSVLADDEKALGVTLVDMGGATTGVAVFHNGNLVHSSIVPIGGQHITNDIARGLSTTIAHAERMKTLWGSAIPSLMDERETVAVPLLGERGVDTIHQVPRSMLTGIIRPRLEEIFELVRNRLEESGCARFGGGRVVLTGGASQLSGAREVAAHWLDRQVRLGVPAQLQGAPDSARAPGFAVAAGLLTYALMPDATCALPSSPMGETNHRPGYMRRVGRWLADSF